MTTPPLLPTGGRADVLQKVQLRVLDNAQCRDWYRSQGKKTKIHDTQICAGFESGGRDACWVSHTFKKDLLKIF